jgi:hypothetical protein
MNKKVNHNKIFICKICDKKYSSASSLCNHNNKFHSEVSQSKVSQNTVCGQSKVSQNTEGGQSKVSQITVCGQSKVS